MTPRTPRAGEDADDLDVEEALALVNDAARAPGDHDPGDRRHGDRPHGTSAPGAPAHRDGVDWAEARATAERAPRRGGGHRTGYLTPVSVPLSSALGLTLAAPLIALTDLPSFDTSAMDGWAVSGPGPWDVREEGVLAGHTAHAPLTDGEAVRIATGARIPPDTTAVLRSEHGRTDDKGGCTPPPRPGRRTPSRTARTSAPAARSAATATSCCPWARW